MGKKPPVKEFESLQAINRAMNEARRRERQEKRVDFRLVQSIPIWRGDSTDPVKAKD
jgi:hypothetical protein